MWTRRIRDVVLVAFSGLTSIGAAEAQNAIQPSLIVKPSVPAPTSGSEILTDDLLLQLEVFVNGVPANLVSAFVLRSDGTMTASYSELDEIGLVVPDELVREDVEIPLRQLPGVAFTYDDAAQTIHFTATAEAIKPLRINGQTKTPEPDPIRPPFGAVLNYTLFASGEDDVGDLNFDGVSAEFESRVFGHFGLVENSFITAFSRDEARLIRLDSSYVYEDPDGLRTFQAGDFISGGFVWTRPIRMGGIQLRRSFGLRPDLITIPLPTLTGSAATPSTLDLYVNSVRTLSVNVPRGPFEIEHPPIIYGGGTAQIALHDALGREIVTSTAFYASPELLAPGLTDYSLEVGLARRNYGVRSNDYDGRIAASASWRRGINEHLTVQAHGETAGSLISAGGGAIFTLGHIGLVSVALSGSRTKLGAGALLDLTFESRTPDLSFALRSQRTLGDYEDLASWTAVLPPDIAHDRRVSGQPYALDQVSLSAPLPWEGGAIGASYVQSRYVEQKSKLLNLSYTQDIGRFSVFASAFRDFELSGSTTFFLGLSLPIGDGITASAGGTRRRRSTVGYVEASQQGHHEPGAFGWVVRAEAGDGEEEAEATARYSSRFARFEGGLLWRNGDFAGHAQIEGALTLVGDAFHFSQRVDNSFAIVEVGAPGVEVFHENRHAGYTNSRGQLIVPNLSPFVANRIAFDPTNLPLNTEVTTTNVAVAPFSRSAVRVDLRVESAANSALVGFVDPEGQPIELGTEVIIEGKTESFVVGYDGQAYIEDLGAHNVVVLTTPDQAQCRAKFAFHPSADEQVRIGNVVCEPIR